MNSERTLLVLILLSCSLGIACSAVDVNLIYQFPKWRNGENYIFLQYREDGEYHDLAPMGYTVFAHPDSSSTLPYAGPVISLGTRANISAGSYINPDRIYIRPAMEKPSGNDTAGVIRIIPPLREGRVDITGEAGMEGTLVPMVIYHGPANYDKPIWSSATPGLFAVNFTFTNSEPIFFAVSAPSNNMGFKGYWKGVILSFTNISPDSPSGLDSTVGSTITTTETPAIPMNILSPYVQSIAVIIAALIGSVTSIWIARRKKE
ncbi:MAG: hypothetical protein LUO97_03600 [Methanomicrobiales archaeon]|nr:hypothetical protein [Methanomicrobiales archaeon]